MNDSGCLESCADNIAYLPVGLTQNFTPPLSVFFYEGGFSGSPFVYQRFKLQLLFLSHYLRLALATVAQSSPSNRACHHVPARSSKTIRMCCGMMFGTTSSLESAEHNSPFSAKRNPPSG